MSPQLDEWLFRIGWWMVGLVTSAIIAYSLGWFDQPHIKATIEAWM